MTAPRPPRLVSPLSKLQGFLSSAEGTRPVRSIALVGDLYTFLATGEETDGRYALFETRVTPGGGPPRHVHSREDEGFYVVEGTVTFDIDGRRVVAGPGTFANLPPGVPHAFRNETDQPARMLVLVAPAGLEQMFLETGSPVKDPSAPIPPPSQEEIDRLLATAPRYGVTIFPPDGGDR